MLSWRMIGSDGRPLRSSGPFEDREEAEAWLASSWEGLAEAGVAEVELVSSEGDAGPTAEATEDERVLYRMSLDEA